MSSAAPGDLDAAILAEEISMGTQGAPFSMTSSWGVSVDVTAMAPLPPPAAMGRGEDWKAAVQDGGARP
ncbi:hypothetical protein GUJ93_ZPchr0318g28950 [Zizania palustris]|uniref:Uncharacterized protein n=1 Tax=Zizania palustris TaxID=103762 RepID=A0A8J5RCQ8_ZIZPA|nr:hypothetical protein GUJ93_ZPchr0318g28950 [Zizania palustris]